MNFFVKGRCFNLKHKQTFLGRITDLCPTHLSKEHSDLLCSAVIRIESTDDPLVKELETFLSMSLLAREKKITRSHLADIIEKHRSTWEPKVIFLGDGTVRFLLW